MQKLDQNLILVPECISSERTTANKSQKQLSFENYIFNFVIHTKI